MSTIAIGRNSFALQSGGFTGPALDRANALVADLGIAFSISGDFDELLAANEANRDSWDALMPQFHPRYFDADNASAFWIKGSDRSGKVMAARGYRRFDLPAGVTLHNSLVDLSLFYDDPAQALPGERIDSAAATPHQISGSFALSGALWVHPASRRLGLPALMKPLGRAVAHDLWEVPLLIALIEDIRNSAGRSDHCERGICWQGSYVAPRCDFTLVWWSREVMAKSVRHFIGGTHLPGRR
jgi:hypothetical protein